MHIGLIYPGDNDFLLKCRDIFTASLQKKDFFIKHYDYKNKEGSIPGAQYLIFLLESSHFSGKKSLDGLNRFFRETGYVSARYASIYIPPKINNRKILLKCMHKLENEGIIIHESRTIRSTKQTLAAAEKLRPVRKHQHKHTDSKPED